VQDRNIKDTPFAGKRFPPIKQNCVSLSSYREREEKWFLNFLIGN
jgi:hypothetical protein